MSAIDMSAVMDAIAERLTENNVSPRVYAWPEGSISAPCAVVGYPTELDFDMTFKRGGDRAVFPVYLLVGNAVTRAARDALSGIIAGATGVKDAIDGNLGGAVQSARVTNCRIEEVAVGGVAYLAARFDTEVFT